MWLQLIERLQVLQAQRAEEALPHFPWVIQRSHGSVTLNPRKAGSSCQESAWFLHKRQGIRSISLTKQHTSDGEVASRPWMRYPLWSRSPKKGKKRGETNSGKLAAIENFPCPFHSSGRVLNIFQCKFENTNCFLESLDQNTKLSKIWEHHWTMATQWKGKHRFLKKGKYNFNSKHNTKAIH